MIRNSARSLGKIIEIKTSGGSMMINAGDIVYVEASGKFSVVHMKKSRDIVAYHMLKWFGDSLPAPFFFRNHNSFLVSCSFIKSYCYRSITMKNKEKLPLSRNRLEDLKKNLRLFLETSGN